MDTWYKYCSRFFATVGIVALGGLWLTLTQTGLSVYSGTQVVGFLFCHWMVGEPYIDEVHPKWE